MQDTKKKMNKNVKIMWNMLKNSNIYIIGFRKGKKIQTETEATFEQVVVVNFP